MAAATVTLASPSCTRHVPAPFPLPHVSSTTFAHANTAMAPISSSAEALTSMLRPHLSTAAPGTSCIAQGSLRGVPGLANASQFQSLLGNSYVGLGGVNGLPISPYVQNSISVPSSGSGSGFGLVGSNPIPIPSLHSASNMPTSALLLLYQSYLAQCWTALHQEMERKALQQRQVLNMFGTLGTRPSSGMIGQVASQSPQLQLDSQMSPFSIVPSHVSSNTMPSNVAMPSTSTLDPVLGLPNASAPTVSTSASAYPSMLFGDQIATSAPAIVTSETTMCLTSSTASTTSASSLPFQLLHSQAIQDGCKGDDKDVNKRETAVMSGLSLDVDAYSRSCDSLITMMSDGDDVTVKSKKIVEPWSSRVCLSAQDQSVSGTVGSLDTVPSSRTPTWMQLQTPTPARPTPMDQLWWR